MDHSKPRPQINSQVKMSYRIVPSHTATVNVIPAQTDRNAAASESEDDVIFLDYVSSGANVSSLSSPEYVMDNSTPSSPLAFQQHSLDLKDVSNKESPIAAAARFPHPSVISHSFGTPPSSSSRMEPPVLQPQYALAKSANSIKKERSTMEHSSVNIVDDASIADTSAADSSCVNQDVDQFQPVPKNLYEFGYSGRGGENKRIFVFQANNKSSVRQYANNNSNFWFCIQCYAIKKKKIRSYFDDEVFMESKFHLCSPLSYEDVKKQQEKIIRRNLLSNPAENCASVTEGAQDGESLDATRSSSRIKSRMAAAANLDDSMDESETMDDFERLNKYEKRIVKRDGFEFGFGCTGLDYGRIAVFEMNRNFVREYSKDSATRYYCRSCNRIKKRKLYALLQDDNSTVRVPPEHFCDATLYSEYVEEQQKISNKYLMGNSMNAENSPNMKYHGRPDTTPQTSTFRRRSVNPVSYAQSPISVSRSLNSTAVPPLADLSVSLNVVSANEVRNRQRTVHPMLKNFVTPIPKTSTFVPVFPSQTSASPPAPLFRDVDSSNFEFGYNENGELGKRLIVYEENRLYVREYASTDNARWRCLTCRFGTARQDTDKFCVKLNHSCPPMLAAFSKERQLQYKAMAVINDGIKNEGVSSSSNSSALSDSKSSITVTRDPIDTNSPLIQLNSAMPSSTPSPMQSMRELQPNEWEYGFDAAGASNKRFIVFESQNHSYVREYRNDGSDMRCLGCASSQSISAKLVNGILLVPLPYVHRCQPRPYSSILEHQKKYEEKGGRKRRRTVDSQLIKKKAKALADDTDTSNSPDGDEFDETYAGMNTSEPMETHEAETHNSIENNVVAAPVDVVQVTPESNLSTSVAYFNPSAFLIAKWCKKLNVKYSGEAYKFWSNIEFSKITPTSVPESCHSIAEETYHGFSCLSLYLTGSEAKTPLIKDMINRYVFENFKSLGIWRGQNFSQCDLQTPVITATVFSFSLTDVHLQCLSQWFQCRIGVFADGKWKRFGNWDEEEADTPTMLMEYKEEKYFPILQLAECNNI